LLTCAQHSHLENESDHWLELMESGNKPAVNQLSESELKALQENADKEFSQ